MTWSVGAFIGGEWRHYAVEDPAILEQDIRQFQANDIPFSVVRRDQR